MKSKRTHPRLLSLRTLLAALLAVALSVPQPCVAAVAEAVREGTSTTVFGGVTVTGGMSGVDYDVSVSPLLLTVKTGTPLSFSGTGEGSIKIAEGVDASITLDNLDLTSKSSAPTTAADRNSPIDLWPGSSLHITLADGSTNYLRTQLDTNCAGIHVAETAKLTIDDSVTNRLTDGTHVEVDGGKIATAGTLLDGTEVAVGDEILKLASDDPGVLKVAGGYGCAAIGSGSMENAGLMVFDGGSVVAVTWRGVAVDLDNPGAGGDADIPVSGSYYASAGAGIGAGCGGGATDMVFNAADIDAYGSYHGAAIGAPLRYEGGTTYNGGARQPSALTTTPNSTCGNITINGGFLKARGFTHGNAFGGACDSAAAPGAKGKVIKVTGGTLLPTSGSGHWDLGGRDGTVIVTGGSMRIANMSKFQGDGPWSDETKTTKLTMVTIDMKAELEQLDSLNSKISGWQLFVNGQPHSYGAPTMFDDGKLYLWLSDAYLQKDPETGKSARIEVRLNYIDANGKEQRLEPLYVEELGGSSGSTLKRYVNIDLDNEELDPAAREVVAGYFSKLDKYYDGLPLPGLELSEEEGHYISTAGLETVPKRLTDSSSLEYTYQTVSEEVDKNGDPVIIGSGSSLPTDSGRQLIEIVSKQYASDPGMQSYWGHRIRGNAVINPVNSATQADISSLGHGVDVEVGGETRSYSEPTWAQGSDSAIDFNTATMDCLVVPFDVTSGTIPGTDTPSAATCAAPTGTVSLYLDGRPLTASQGGVIELDEGTFRDASVPVAVEKVDGREHVVGYFKITRSQLEAWGLAATEDNQHTVQVRYTSVTSDDPPLRGERSAGPAYEDSAYLNYYESESPVTNVEIEIAQPGFTLYSGALTATGFDPAAPFAKDPSALDVAAARMSYLDGERDDAGNLVVGDDGSLKTWVVDADYEAAPAQQVVDGAMFIGKDKNWFDVYTLTSSVGEIDIVSSDPGVVAVEPNASLVGRRAQYRPGTSAYVAGTKARVVGPGVAVITATIHGTGAYDGATRSFRVFVNPDLATEPALEAAMTARDVSRSDGTVRPGDTVRYTAVVSNTAGLTMYQNPVYSLTVPADATLSSLRLVAADGSVTALEEGSGYTRSGDTLTVASLPALYGGQSVRFVMDVTVNDGVILPEHGPLEALRSECATWGVYGQDKFHGDVFPWDTRFDFENGKELGSADEPAASAWADPMAEKRDPSDPDPDDPSHTVDDAEGTETRPVDPGAVMGDDELAEVAARIAAENGKGLPDGVTPTVSVTRVDGAGGVTVTGGVPLSAPSTYRVAVTWEHEGEDGSISTTTVVVQVDVTDGDDHDLVVVPADPDVPAGDISVAKTWANVTAGAEDRGNREVVQVGDELLYTITATNAKAGSVYHAAVVADTLPVGVEYVPGSIEVVCRRGTEKERLLKADDFSVDYGADSRTLYVAVGDLYGGETATVRFRARVTAERLSHTDPQSLVNVGRAFGTLPTDTVSDPDPDPDDPDAPKKVVVTPPDDTPGPFGDDNPPADPTLDDRKDEEPADVELEYTEHVRAVAADAEVTSITRDELLGHLRGFAAADGYELGAEPTDLAFTAAHAVAPLGRAVTGDEATSLVETGRSDLAATYVAEDGSRVRAVLHHVVWDDGTPEDERPGDGPAPGTFSAAMTVSERVSEGTVTASELKDRALALAADRGLTLPAGVAAGDWRLVRVAADGSEEAVAPDAEVDLSEPATYRADVSYHRDAAGDTRGLTGTLALGYVLFDGTYPESDPVPGTVGPVAPADPDTAQVTVVKESANKTPHGDGKAHVGDLISYTVTVANGGSAETCVYDVVVSDELPVGVEVVAGTMTLELPSGETVAVPDAVCDPATHAISVFGGSLKGGERVVLRFDARVTEDAEGRDIGNHAVASFVRPSDAPTETIFGRDDDAPGPGDPAKPEDFAGSVVLDPTPAAYPDGASDPVAPAEGGSGGADGNGTDGSGGSGTLRPALTPLSRVPVGRILPVTGDVASLVPVLGSLAAVALGATGALVARSRRRDG